MVGGKQSTLQPVVDLGVEDRDPSTVGGDHVGVAVRKAMDQTLEAKASQVAGHLSLRVGRAAQAAHLGTKAPVGEAADGMNVGAESASQAIARSSPNGEHVRRRSASATSRLAATSYAEISS
jgi:hypothetical protein